jgi:hypothetical protein
MRRLAVTCAFAVLCSACDSELPTAPASHRVAVSDHKTPVVDKILTIDPSDIESIEIVKGAAAAALYGHGCTATFSVIVARKRS